MKSTIPTSTNKLPNTYIPYLLNHVFKREIKFSWKQNEKMNYDKNIFLSDYTFPALIEDSIVYFLNQTTIDIF